MPHYPYWSSLKTKQITAKYTKSCNKSITPAYISVILKSKCKFKHFQDLFPSTVI